MNVRMVAALVLSLQLGCGEGAKPAAETRVPEKPAITDSTWSPDSSMVAWVISWASLDSSELWLGYRDGREAIRLTGGRPFDSDVLPTYRELTFTLDGERLVYTVPRYVVSDGVDMVDLRTFEVTETETGANDIILIPRGQYAGMLALLQGRWPGPDGTREFGYWLYTSDLKEIRKIADEGDYEAWAAKHVPPAP